MLFLVKVEIEKLPQMPTRNFFELLIKEWEYYERMKKKGKVLAGGKLAGRRGAAAIFDAEDHAEMEEIVTKLPLFPLFTKIEITPLVAQEKALQDARRMFQLVKDLDIMVLPTGKKTNE